MGVYITCISWPFLGCSQVSSALSYIIRLMQAWLMVLAMQHELANRINCELKVWKWVEVVQTGWCYIQFFKEVAILTEFPSSHWLISHPALPWVLFGAMNAPSTQTYISRTSGLFVNCLSHTEPRRQLSWDYASLAESWKYSILRLHSNS